MNERGERSGQRPRTAPSLSFWVAGPLAVALLVFVGPGLWIAAWAIEGAILKNELGVLARTHDEWTRRMNDRLIQAEASVARYGRMLTSALHEVEGETPQKFDALVGPSRDGGMVSRNAGFEPRRDAIVWLPAGYPLDDREKVFLLELKRMTELYSAGAPGEPINTWLIPRRNGLVMYWPSYTSYIDQVDTTVDFVNSEWTTLVLPANNPEGKPRWTPTSYDPGAREWMVSVVVPFFRDGVFAGSAGHDVTVNAVMDSFRELSLYPGTEHALVRGDGTVLVSSVHQDKIHGSKGTLTVESIGDDDLKRAFEAAKRDDAAEAHVVGGTDQRVIVAARIAAPDWVLLTDVPRAALLSSVKGLYWDYWLIAAFSILALVALPVLVIMRVTLPSVRQLVTAAERIRGGDLEQRFEASGTREFVHIGDALNGMAQQLRETFAALAKTNEELEQRVEQRTAELKEATVAADAANRAKSDFLANMSHELRTPLNGILGYAQILKRSRSLGEQDLRGVEVIAESGSHLLTLINDVLDLAKIESRTMEIHPNDFHFPSFLNATAEICRIRAEQKGIAFVFKPGPALPEGVRADQRRLRQILLNLLGNAIKFTENGSVTFTVAEVPGGSRGARKDLPEDGASPESRTKTHRIRFEIEDTGTGIGAEHLDQIFLPFKQVGDKSRHREGTGLGLAISQRIVTLMGGSIQVRSELGKGSVFWMDLTLAEAPDWTDTVRRTEQGQIVGYKGARRRLLVVDDKPENRAVVISMLATLGFELAEANDGQEGLDRTARERFDLIITDLAMPVLDGWEMMRRMRRAPELAGTVIIASSASAFITDQDKSLEAGADDFLAKPLQMDELLEKLQRHLKLEWIYERQDGASEEAEPSPSSGVTSTRDVVLPPDEDLKALRDLARKGLVNHIQKYADKLELGDPRLAPFAKHLRELSEDFRLESIEELVGRRVDGGAR
ncbi:two-component hybrid sensor and regulator [Sorangium cellulosum So ce56]|uniref:histidine kinase n=1 Tax=Sorangium cellulosum (strain So ce56) TaxID=448385 RepID=A9G383_SORC5|nr:hybrid sensor histidine kinase/response regulator [Sorangium cellulosum]CAN95734.1 two-component hybrid sensor and regulator [Sorangium cellulosum So ce56]